MWCCSGSGGKGVVLQDGFGVWWQAGTRGAAVSAVAAMAGRVAAQLFFVVAGWHCECGAAAVVCFVW